MCGESPYVDPDDRRPAETQGAYILRRLRDYGAVTAIGMAAILAVPEASVRRAIVGLRKQGYHILTEQGIYRLL